MKSKEIKWSVVFLSVILILLLAFILNDNVSASEGKTIDVLGKSSIDVNYDVITIDFLLKSEGKSEREAMERNNQRLSIIKNDLMSYGINSEDITIYDYKISEEISSRDFLEKSFVSKYYIRIYLDEKKLNLAGVVVDSAILNGASLKGVNFELSSEKENEYKIKVIELASKDAYLQAKALAKGLGLRVGEVVSINKDFRGRVSPVKVYEASENSFLDKRSAVLKVNKIVNEFNPSKKRISASVSVTYLLKKGFF